MKTDTSREAFEAWAYQVENFSSRLERMEDWRAFEAALWTAWNEAWQESRKQALEELQRKASEADLSWSCRDVIERLLEDS